LALAAHMPALQLRAVCADPDVRQQAASAGLTNVQLVPPAGELRCWFVQDAPSGLLVVCACWV
jgi:hypothetical protein